MKRERVDWDRVFAERLAKDQGVKCACGGALVYRGNLIYWCDDLQCMNLYIMDLDAHVVPYGRVSKCEETRCSL